MCMCVCVCVCVHIAFVDWFWRVMDTGGNWHLLWKLEVLLPFELLLPSVILQKNIAYKINSKPYSVDAVLDTLAHAHQANSKSETFRIKQKQNKNILGGCNYGSYLNWAQDIIMWSLGVIQIKSCSNVLDGGSIFVSIWPHKTGFLHFFPLLIIFPTSCLEALFVVAINWKCSLPIFLSDNTHPPQPFPGCKIWQ